MKEQLKDEQLNENFNPITELESLIKDPKCTQDLTEETNEEIEKLERLGVNEFNYQHSVEVLLLFEKKCRQVSDSNSSCKVILKIITWLLKYSSIEDVLVTTQKICKKRGQLKKVISFIIQIFLDLISNSIVNLNPKFVEYNSFKNRSELREEFVNYSIKDLDECLKIIGTLDEITQGKIYLELERARLMLILSSIKQEKNEIKEASLILEDVAVETIGNMELKEKTQYVLEQMRLSLLCEDFVRLQIFAKKINPKIIQRFSDLKIIYYQYLIILWHNEQNPKEISQCFLCILDSIIDNIENNENYDIIDRIPGYMTVPIDLYGFCEKKLTINTCIEGFIVYLILDSYSLQIKDELLLFKNKYCKYIERNVPYCMKFLEDYINQELLFLESTKTFNYTIPDYFNELSNCFIFKNGNKSNKDIYYTEYKRCKINLCNSQNRFLLFLHRIQERNLVVISKYYKTISFLRLQDLLNLDDQELQITINNLVEKNIFSAKINQPAGKIFFINNCNKDLFNKFHRDIGTILNKIDLLSDLISNDLMINQFKNEVK